jgi:hypothetical protein
MASTKFENLRVYQFGTNRITNDDTQLTTGNYQLTSG